MLTQTAYISEVQALPKFLLWLDIKLGIFSDQIFLEDFPL